VIVIKLEILNLVRTTPLYNNLHQVRPKSNISKPNKIFFVGGKETKGHKQDNQTSVKVTYACGGRTLV
jgi:hypothetical protein